MGILSPHPPPPTGEACSRSHWAGAAAALLCPTPQMCRCSPGLWYRPSPGGEAAGAGQAEADGVTWCLLWRMGRRFLPRGPGLVFVCPCVTGGLTSGPSVASANPEPAWGRLLSGEAAVARLCLVTLPSCQPPGLLCHTCPGTQQPVLTPPILSADTLGHSEALHPAPPLQASHRVPPRTTGLCVLGAI